MELWQAAAILGVDDLSHEWEEDERYVGTFAGRPITAADRERLRKFGQAEHDQIDLTGQVAREMGINFGADR